MQIEELIGLAVELDKKRQEVEEQLIEVIIGDYIVHNTESLINPIIVQHKVSPQRHFYVQTLEQAVDLIVDTISGHAEIGNGTVTYR